MIAIVVLALIMVPVFFVVVQKLFASRAAKKSGAVASVAPAESAETRPLR
jgi:hypothetical protein